MMSRSTISRSWTVAAVGRLRQRKPGDRPPQPVDIQAPLVQAAVQCTVTTAVFRRKDWLRGETGLTVAEAVCIRSHRVRR